MTTTYPTFLSPNLEDVLFLRSKVWEASRKVSASGPAGSLLREMLESSLLNRRGNPSDLQDVLVSLADILKGAAKHRKEPSSIASSKADTEGIRTSKLASSEGLIVWVVNRSLTSKFQGKSSVFYVFRI